MWAGRDELPKHVGALTACFVIPALLASCSNGEAGSPPAPQTSETEAVSTAPAAAPGGERADYQAIRFQADDGAELVGRLWGAATWV